MKEYVKDVKEECNEFDERFSVVGSDVKLRRLYRDVMYFMMVGCSSRDQMQL